MLFLFLIFNLLDQVNNIQMWLINGDMIKVITNLYISKFYLFLFFNYILCYFCF